MRPIGSRTPEEQIEYHLRDGRAPEFDKGQPGRVDLARFLIDKILKKDLTRRPLRFIELGCGAGDITGPYSGERYLIPEESHPKREHLSPVITVTADIDNGIEVHGWDIVPAAKEACARRWPDMVFHLEDVAAAEPMECDLIVLTEFLEHVSDPVGIVKRWLPLAKWAIIGHPLDEPDPPFEPGHIWSYTRGDWRRWFEIGGHHWWEEFRFPMGYWDAMILGHSARHDQIGGG